MSQHEIILNLWYVIDDMGVIYALRARAYIGTGSDEEKMALLQQYALVDYLIARIFPIPSKFHIDGQPIYHKAGLDLMSSPAELFEEAIQALQRDLPSQTPLDIPTKPLVCVTPLMGDDDGNIRPQFSDIERYS